MGKVFKKSLMGFSKEQVNAYIEALVDKHKAALEEEKEKYNQLLEENEKLTGERDEALAIAREELEEELTALRDEKDELNGLIEELKGENTLLHEANEKLTGEKNQLSQDIGEAKARLDEYINSEALLKAKAESLENEKKQLSRQMTAELDKARLRNAQLESQLRAKSFVPPVRNTPVPQVETGEKTEVVWENLKGKINGLAEEFSQLADKVKQEESREAASKTISIRDILEKVKRIGEKI